MDADVEQSDACSSVDEAEEKAAALEHLEATVISYVLVRGSRTADVLSFVNLGGRGAGMLARGTLAPAICCQPRVQLVV